MSSPVSLFGPGNQSASVSSIVSPSAGSRTRASAARRGGGTRPISLSSALPACGPQIRTTATAAGGRPDERAKIVGRSRPTGYPATGSVNGGSRRAKSVKSRQLRRIGKRCKENASESRTRAWSEKTCPRLIQAKAAFRNTSPAKDRLSRRSQSMTATTTASDDDARHQNRLARETSPYLLQHQNNPVDWWAWGPEALAEAKRTQKPILRSLGYAACHWCHVMAHESFENDATARVMNELFVNVKVDREERPDIDQIYMAALHHLGEQGGWPLTMFLTPAGEPIW